jgi:septation ring formation regulator EzrA
MEYVITNGKQYITSKSGIKAIDSINKAQKFELEKANNVLKSIPKTLRMSEWKVVPYNEVVSKNKNNTHESEASLEKYTGLTDNILDRMMDWENYIKQLQEYSETLNFQLSNADLEISDIEHVMENYDFDMFKGWKLYKMLQDARRRRRKVKDERMKIDYILKSNFVDCTSSSISNYIKGLDNRTYTPRILKDLLEI